MTEATTDMKPGDITGDGLKYVGISPDNGRPMYTTLEDEVFTFNFNMAAEYAKQGNDEKYLGYDDWRVPTSQELKLLFNNKAAIGGFDRFALAPSDFYWSSTSYTTSYGGDGGLVRRLKDGSEGWADKARELSLRLVRG